MIYKDYDIRLPPHPHFLKVLYIVALSKGQIVTLRYTLLVFCITAICFSARSQGQWETDFWKRALDDNPKRNGSYTEHHKGGQLKLKGRFVNGIPDSTWVFYSEAGNIIAESHYSGLYRQWTGYGDLAVVGHYKNGEPVGFWEYGFSVLDSVIQIVRQDYHFDTETLRVYLPQGTLKKEESMTRAHFIRREQNQGGGFVGFSLGVQNIDVRSLSAYSVNNGGTPISPFSNFYGIHIGGNLYNNLTFFLSYNRLMKNRIFELDSISKNVYGGHIKYEMGYDMIKINKFDLGPSAGLGVGRLRVDLNEQVSNWTVQLDLNWTARLNLSLTTPEGIGLGQGVSIGVTAGYKVDFAATSWAEPYNGNILKITETKLSGYYFVTSLSWFIF